MLVNVPAFSVWLAQGRKKTSVPIWSVTISPVSISGPSFQNVAVSIICMSRTTSQSRLARPSRCIFPLACPIAGFSPTTKYPEVFLSIWSRTIPYVPWSPVRRGM